VNKAKEAKGMNSRDTLQTVCGIITVVLLLVGCGAQETAPEATLIPEFAATSPSVMEAPTALSIQTPSIAGPAFKDSSLCPDSDAATSVPERLSSEQWVIVESPLGSRLRSLQVKSANEAWIADSDWDLLLYDGSTWLSVQGPTTDKSIRGMTMLSTDEGWAVGFDAMSPSRFGFVLHYADQNWSTVDAPTSAELELYAVSFPAPDSGWVVGTEILRYSGGHWETFASAEDLAIPARPRILEKHGSLRAITMISEDEGWAVGDRGSVFH
jgi:hypothetical protein